MHTYAQYHDLPHHKHGRVNAFFMATVIRTFVISYLILFLPILIMEHFSYFGTQISLLITGCYFVFLSVVQLLYIPAISYISSNLGLRFSFFLGLLFLLSFILMMNSTYYLVSLLFLGLAAMFWWYSYHLYFTQYASRGKYGKAAGLVEAFSVLSGALAPSIGGYLLIQYGSSVYFIFGAVVLILAFVFVFYIRSHRAVKAIGYRDILNVYRKRRRDYFAFIGAGAEEAIGTIIWPLLLYFIFQDFLKVGSYFSFVMMAVSVTNYLVGLVSDKFKKERLEEIGSTAVFSSWIIRVFTQNPALLGIVEVIYKFFLTFFRLPLLVIAYDHAFEDKESYIAFREASYKIGAILGYLSFIFVVISGLPLWSILLFSAVYSLFPMRIKS